MDYTLRIIISIIAVIGGGFSIGFILYGLLVKDDGDIVKRYLVVFALCAIAFFGANYELYLVKTVRIPPAYGDYLAPAVKNVSSGKADFGVVGVKEKDDGSIEIKLMFWKYLIFKHQEEEYIDSFIEEFAFEYRKSIAGIEYAKPYNDLKITVSSRNLNSIEVYSMAALLPYVGKFYRYMFYREEDPKIAVSIINEETGEVVDTGEV